MVKSEFIYYIHLCRNVFEILLKVLKSMFSLWFNVPFSCQTKMKPKDTFPPLQSWLWALESMPLGPPMDPLLLRAFACTCHLLGSASSLTSFPHRKCLKQRIITNLPM